jgi:glutamyl-tRNA reductase
MGCHDPCGRDKPGYWDNSQRWLFSPGRSRTIAGFHSLSATCMAFIALGINHKTASVDVRERVAFTPEQLVEALQQLCQRTSSREAAILSTCNRSELYLEQDDLSADEVLAWLASYHQLSLDELRACAYIHADDEAVRHMMRVASGLDSMVLGEPQILGQMKSAFAVAREAGTLGPLLGRLFQATFSTAKTVRTDTAIGENPVSVAFAAVSLAKQIFADLHRSQALLIGAGETISLVARHLHDQGIKRIVVANRTLERASNLAEQFGAHAVLLADIPAELVNSDIVISSTASQLPILGKGAVERALKQRKHKPIFMVDIAVPRDIEPEVGELDDVYLYTVDDLHEVIAENLKSRQGAAQAAEELVAVGAQDFMQRLRELAAVDVLKAYRQQAERLRDEELNKALRLLNNGSSAEDVLALLARGLTNKLLHAPSVQLKKFSADGRVDALGVAQELFALDEGAPPASTHSGSANK